MSKNSVIKGLEFLLLFALLLFLNNCSRYINSKPSDLNDGLELQGLHTINYSEFDLLLSCKKKSAVGFRYVVGVDQGNFPRLSGFSFDMRCQQLSTGSYESVVSGYDRGHLVPANHMDGSKVSIRETNFMADILSQTRELNRGVWLRTEELIECAREIGPVTVIGGAIWTQDLQSEFLESHGLYMPKYFWKVVILDNAAAVFLFPNTHEVSSVSVWDYLVELELIPQAELKILLGDRAIENENINKFNFWSQIGGYDQS